MFHPRCPQTRHHGDSVPTIAVYGGMRLGGEEKNLHGPDVNEGQRSYDRYLGGVVVSVERFSDHQVIACTVRGEGGW